MDGPLNVCFFHYSADHVSNLERGRFSAQSSYRSPRPETAKPVGHRRRQCQAYRFRPCQDLRLLHTPHLCRKSPIFSLMLWWLLILMLLLLLKHDADRMVNLLFLLQLMLMNVDFYADDISVSVARPIQGRGILKGFWGLQPPFRRNQNCK